MTDASSSIMIWRTIALDLEKLIRAVRTAVIHASIFAGGPVWFRVPEASEVYYRYDLPDRTALVICEYKYYAAWMENYKNRYSDMNPERTETREYLLTPGYHYLYDCRSNRSTMIDKLKEIQKRG